MTLDELFKAAADFDAEKAENEIRTCKTCKTCKHRQRWECNSKVFQYCGVRKSNRTFNGHLKIKCKQPACGLYQQKGGEE